MAASRPAYQSGVVGRRTDQRPVAVGRLQQPHAARDPVRRLPDRGLDEYFNGVAPALGQVFLQGSQRVEAGGRHDLAFDFDDALLQLDVPDATFACPDLTTFCRLDELGLVVFGQRLEHLRGSALAFRNLTNYIARSLLETGGFKPQLHRQSG
jgi:hypothetical protein